MEEYTVKEKLTDARLDVFIKENILTSITRSAVRNLIKQKKILVNNKFVKAGYIVKPNDKIQYEQPIKQTTNVEAENINLDIVYEDEYLVVINKPQNMVVHPAGNLRSGTLVNALLYHFKHLSKVNGEFRPGIVHRLDKDTSGLIVIAKDDKTHIQLQKQIQNKICHRIYKAVVYGKFNSEEGTIDTCLARGTSQHQKIFVVPNGQGRRAITYYKVLSYNSGFSFVEYELKTGRTHQIRVHSAHLGHPIVGDKLYGKKEEKFNLQGQLLHATGLVFIHPFLKKEMSFYSPLPNYFKKFLEDHNLI